MSDNWDYISGYEASDGRFRWSLRAHGCGCCAGEKDAEDVTLEDLSNLEDHLKENFESQMKLITRVRETVWGAKYPKGSA
jgi:hypothetical protein